MTIIHIHEGEFEKEVLQSALPVCVDYWADWCEPCRMLSPTMDELAKEFCGKMKFCKVNIDEVPTVALERRVMSIPTLSIFVNGAEVKRMVGLQEKNELKHELDAIVK